MARPFAELTTVDVFSATTRSTSRELVREYQLAYTSNTTQTRSYLRTVQLVGDCDSVGLIPNAGIPEAGFSPAAVASCVAKEAVPPTTYTYYGVPDRPTARPPTAPSIIAAAYAYGTPAAADFLADLNGDAVADLVAGNNGMDYADQCEIAQNEPTNDAPNGCVVSGLAYATGGLFGAFPKCPCLNNYGAPTELILGGPGGPSAVPTPGVNGNTILTGAAQLTTTNGLTTYLDDDSMWAFTVFADWAASGQTSFLQIGPNASALSAERPQNYQVWFPQGTNAFLGQFSGPAQATGQAGQGPSQSSTYASLQSLNLSGAEQTYLSQLINEVGNESVYGSYNFGPDPGVFPAAAVPDAQLGVSLSPSNAMDIDGDGLPDMTYLDAPTLTGLVGPGGTTLLSTRDHTGATHPFSRVFGSAASAWENPTWTYVMPWCTGVNGQNEAACGGGNQPYTLYPGGTFTLFSGPNNGATTWSTVPAHGLADLDGDGLADQIIANKFRADWNTTMRQFFDTNVLSTDEGMSHYPNGFGLEGEGFLYVGLVYLPNRGDGRFGAPLSDTVSGESEFGSQGVDTTFVDYGYYLTPGATAPFAPYQTAWNATNSAEMGVTDPGPQGSPGLPPPYAGTGPIPPPQSDPISVQSGYAMGQSAIQFADLNGDGMADYAILDPNGLHICVRYGAWLDTAHWECTATEDLLYYNPTDSPLQQFQQSSIMVGDLNASGINQIVYFFPPNAPLGAPAGSEAFLVSPNGTTGAPRDGLLEGISNGVGAHTTFNYATVNSLNIGPLPVPAWVVTSVATTNGLTGSQGVNVTKQYAYTAPLYDAREQAFVGFQSVTETTSSDASGSPGLVTTTSFATQTDLSCGPPLSGCGASLPEALIHFSRGLPVAVETSENSATARWFATTTYQYALQEPYIGLDGRLGLSVATETTSTYPWSAGQGVALQPPPSNSVYISSTPTWYLPGATVAIPSGGATRKQQRTFDPNGNDLTAVDFGVLGQDVPILSVNTWNLSPGDATGWSYRVTKSVTGNADPTGATLDTSKAIRELDFQYDSLGRLTQTWTPLTGGLPLPGPAGGSRAAGMPPTAVLSASSLVLRTLQYDVNGNVTGIGNQDNPCLASVTYDPLFDQLPATHTVSPNGCGSPGLTTSETFDRRLDAMTSMLDPAGRVTARRLDDFGRTIEVDQPNILILGATTEVLSASYVDSGPIRLVAFGSGYGPDTSAIAAPAFGLHYQYIDGLGETRAVVDEADPAVHNGNQWTVSGVHTSYANGRAATVYQPMYGSGPVAAGTLPPEVQAPTSAHAEMVYDGAGRTVSATDFDGHTSTTTYRDAALSVDSRDPEQVSGTHQGSLTTVTHDGHGRVSSTDAHWNVGPSGAAGDLVTTAIYQATGEATSITQAFPGGSLARQMTYDSLGRLVQNTEPNVGTWTYAYDAESRLVGTSDARGCGQDLFYDLAGRILAADYSPCEPAQPDYTQIAVTSGAFPYPGAEESYAYDPGTGELRNVADRGRADTYAYNAAGYLTAIARRPALPGTPVAYGAIHLRTYDQFTVTGAVRVDNTSSTLFATGAPLTEVAVYALDGSLGGLGVESLGAILSSPSYDPSGRTLSMTFGQSSTVTGMLPTVGTYAYDGNGALTALGLERGIMPGAAKGGPGYTQPPPGNPAFISELTNQQIARDMVGNPVITVDPPNSAWPSGAAAASHVYSYSDDYRLQSVATNTGSDAFADPYLHEELTGNPLYPQPEPPQTGLRSSYQSFTYDWRGNVTSSSDDATDFFDRSLGSVTPVPGTDQIASASSLSGNGSQDSLTTQYDAAGNLTSLLVNKTQTMEYSYAWDELGRLSSATRADGNGDLVTENYGYAGDGSRIWTGRTVDGAAPTYTVSIFDSLVLKNAALADDYEDDASTEQLYAGGGLARVFADVSEEMPYTTNQPQALGGAPIHMFLNLSDLRGSSSFAIDQGTGELVERTAYLGYGGADADYRNPRWQSSREDLKYTGQWDNSEVGVSYYGARYYSPQLGRFISPDPMTIHGVGGDLNPYEYAYGNPIFYTDPTGQEGQSEDGSDPNYAMYGCGQAANPCNVDDPPVVNPFIGDPGITPVSDLPDPNDTPITYTWWQSATDNIGLSSSVQERDFIQDMNSREGPAGLGEFVPEEEELREYESTTAGPSLPSARGSLPSSSIPAPVPPSPVPVAAKFVQRVGTSPLAPVLYSVSNPAGGRVWVSIPEIDQTQFKDLVKYGTDIISGTHGNLDGTLTLENPFYQEDVAKFAGLPGVRVYDIAAMSDAQLQAVVNGPSRVICAWCYSERSLAVLAALGFTPPAPLSSVTTKP